MPDTADTGPVLGRPLRSVRVRITLAAVVVTAVAMTAAGWLLVRSVEDTQLGRVRDDTGAYLEEVTDRLEAGEDPWAAVAPTGTADTTTRPPPFVQVMDDQGHTLAVHPTLPRGSGDATVALSLSADGAGTGAIIKSGTSSGAAAPPEGATGAGGAGAAGEPVGPDEAALETGIMLVRAEDGEPIERIVRQVDTPSGAMTVYAAAPVDEVQGSVDAVRRALWTWLPVLVAVVALVAWHLVGRALRPVEAIRSEVAAIGGATMHRRVPAPDTDDEIGRLAHTMNAMLGRLEASATRQRQFVSDASHELRSPVAAIRTDLEVALREGPDADWAVVASSVLAEEARLERLLDDLLVLAASDESAVAATDGPVDLAALLADDAARARRVAVRFDAPAAASVPGRAGALGRVVANLVDNAARHARTRVELSLQAARLPSGAPAVQVLVDDDGHGIAPADRERVFERFTRLDEGRARDGGGAGLGLAVVRSIVARHGGRVWATDGPLGGARIVVELPAAV